MIRSIASLCVLVAGLCPALVKAAAPPAFSTDDIKALLPPEKVHADLMGMRPQPRFIELSARLQAAASKDSKWWESHLKKAVPGRPLPYDARMGMSGEEYAELLRLANRPALARIGTGMLAAARKPGRVVLGGDKVLTDLAGIEIRLDGSGVKTPFGVATTRSRIEASDAQKATGPWSGIQWKMQRVNTETGHGAIVRFALGRLRDSGRGILYYDAKSVNESGRKAVSHIIFFDLKPAK